jgi:putative transposase
MKPYSTDFRLKVVHAYEKGEGSQRDLARIFAVSLSFVQGLLQRYRQTGSVEPSPHGGGNPGKIGPYLGVVQQQQQQQPDASLAERCERLAAATQGRVGRTTMHRVLKQLRLTRKKRLSALRNKTRLTVAKLELPTRQRSLRSQPTSGSSSMKPAAISIWLVCMPGLRVASEPLRPSHVTAAVP